MSAAIALQILRCLAPPKPELPEANAMSDEQAVEVAQIDVRVLENLLAAGNALAREVEFHEEYITADLTEAWDQALRDFGRAVGGRLP